MKIRKKNRANYIYFDLPFQLDQYGRKTTERVDCLVYSFAIVDLMSKEVTVHRNVMGKCVVAKGYDSVIFYIGEPSRINTLLISLKKLYLHVNQYSGKDNMLGYVSEREFKLQFEDSFKRFFKPLCFHAMSFVKDADIAKDIVHDVFLTTWAQRRKIDFTQPMLPYYLSLTRNRSLNYLDHLKVRARHEENESYKNLLYAETDYSEHEELIRQIMNRINQLPYRCGEVMRLCFIECKKYKEIAEILGVSVNTVKTHISLGLKILRKEFPASLLFAFFSLIKSSVTPSAHGNSPGIHRSRFRMPVLPSQPALLRCLTFHRTGHTDKSPHRLFPYVLLRRCPLLPQSLLRQTATLDPLSPSYRLAQPDSIPRHCCGYCKAMQYHRGK